MLFSRWGAFVYRRRRWLAVLAIVVAAGFGSLAGSTSSHLTSGGWLDPGSESAQVSDRLEKDYGAGRTSFVALFESSDPNADATSSDFQSTLSITRDRIPPARRNEARYGRAVPVPAQLAARRRRPRRAPA